MSLAKTCFVVMPFGKGPEYGGQERESTFVFEHIIKTAVMRATTRFRSTNGDTPENALIVHRELENGTMGDVTAQIVRHLAESDITIVDLTGRNPNVFLELGVRFALKRNGTILLTQDSGSIPFNVQQFRVVEYDPRFDGIEVGTARLEAAIVEVLTNLAGPSIPTTDSLVFQSLPALTIRGAGLAEEAPSDRKRISWDEYWEHTTHVENELLQLHASGTYSPDVLIGISNGGLFLADTCLRLVYGNKVPLICLWARRSHGEERYFSNAINDAIVNPELFATLMADAGVPATRPLRVLVMDDIVGTQRTFGQLVEYLHERLGDLMDRVELRFIFLYTSREITLSKLQGYRLSADTSVSTYHGRPLDLERVTSRVELPYRKNIHYGDVAKPGDAHPS